MNRTSAVLLVALSLIASGCHTSRQADTVGRTTCAALDTVSVVAAGQSLRTDSMTSLRQFETVEISFFPPDSLGRSPIRSVRHTTASHSRTHQAANTSSDTVVQTHASARSATSSRAVQTTESVESARPFTQGMAWLLALLLLILILKLPFNRKS